MQRYDPNEPVCDNQADFNMAFRNALRYNEQQNIKKAGPWLWVYVALYLVFFVWAIVLAMKVPAGQNRTLHLTVAIVLSPAYVLAYYLGMMRNK